MTGTLQLFLQPPSPSPPVTMVAYPETGDGRSLENGQDVDERRPLLEEERTLNGILPRRDGPARSSSGSELSTRTCVEIEPPRAPWGPLAVLLAITAVQPLCFELIFPFVSAWT